MKTLVDGNGHATSYAYDAKGYLAQVTLPGGDVVQFPSYNDAGQLLQRVDGNGVATNYRYDTPDGQLSEVRYPGSPARNVVLAYDGYGRPTTRTDATGSRVYSFGDRDELLQVTTQYAGLPARAIGYGYYPDGSRAGMTTPGGSFAYAYDAAGHLTGLTNPRGEATQWDWYGNDRLNVQRHLSTVNQAYTYHVWTPKGELREATSYHGGDSIFRAMNMVYDGAGNRLQVEHDHFAAPNLNGVVSYQYDNKDQVTHEDSTRVAWNGGQYSHGFGYDNAGNPVNFAGQSRAYNAKNQRVGAGFAYDNNGNPTLYRGAGLSFTPENEATTIGNMLTADYTAEGLRAWKQNASGTRTYYLYDGTVPVCELDSTGAVKATNTFGADGLVSRHTPAQGSVFYHFNEKGDTVRRLNQAGNVLNTHLYDAFGNTVPLDTYDAPTDTSDPWDGMGAQWGYQTDHETGLVLCTFRYYDPACGRWLTRDPTWYNGGINLYGYCRNNPLIGTDPLGLGENDGYVTNNSPKVQWALGGDECKSIRPWHKGDPTLPGKPNPTHVYFLPGSKPKTPPLPGWRFPNTQYIMFPVAPGKSLGGNGLDVDGGWDSGSNKWEKTPGTNFFFRGGGSWNRAGDFNNPSYTGDGKIMDENKLSTPPTQILFPRK